MKKITRQEFEKKVDTEFAYLTYQDGLSESRARIQALETVSKEYEVQ